MGMARRLTERRDSRDLAVGAVIARFVDARRFEPPPARIALEPLWRDIRSAR
jgi:hypothetical protein